MLCSSPSEPALSSWCGRLPETGCSPVGCPACTAQCDQPATQQRENTRETHSVWCPRSTGSATTARLTFWPTEISTRKGDLLFTLWLESQKRVTYSVHVLSVWSRTHSGGPLVAVCGPALPTHACCRRMNVAQQEGTTVTVMQRERH